MIDLVFFIQVVILVVILVGWPKFCYLKRLNELLESERARLKQENRRLKEAARLRGNDDK